MSSEIKKAVELLNQGDVVAVPTETVYGLAANITDESAIEKIFKVKERPFFDPLIVHVASIEQAKTLTLFWDDSCDVLAKSFWPGPLTLVLKKNDSVHSMITSGLDAVGIRMPDHALTLEIIKQLNHPVAAPSANKFKKTSPTKAEHVKNSFPKVFVVDGGECRVGIESTVVGIDEESIKIFRPGMISKQQIETILKENKIYKTVSETESPVAPGQLEHHYMPEIPIVLVYDNAELSQQTQIPKSVLASPYFLALDSNPMICARELYQSFRQDPKKYSSIIIAFESGLIESEYWSSIHNRLEKAATYLAK